MCTYHFLLSFIIFLAWLFLINNISSFTNFLSFTQVIDVLKTFEWLVVWFCHYIFHFGIILDKKKITNQLIFTRNSFYYQLKKTLLLLNWHLPNLGCQLIQTNKISRLFPYASLRSLPYPRQGSRLTSAHALWRSKPFWKRSKNEFHTASTRSFEQ